MINTMKSSNLLTRTGLLTILGVVALSNPAFANTEDSNTLDAKTPHYNKAVLTVAAEIMALPNDDVRKSFYHLARMINKSWDLQDNQTEKHKMKA